ncbi:MAG: alpha/beta hydrolase-fold protein [bacterium]
MPSYLAAVLLLVALAPAATSQSRSGTAPKSAQPLVMGQTFSIVSKTMGESRRINVYLPQVYADSPSVRLPVLYMPDGGMAEDFLHVAGLVEVSVGNSTMRPFILVGIENTERRRDMTGPTTRDDDKKIAVHVGGSAVFRQFIRGELMPEIKQRYRTTNETAIVGESLAGLFVVETFFLEPDLFDTYIAFDPSLWWNGASLIAKASERLRTRPASKKTLYFASSDEKGIIENTERLSDLLTKDASRDLNWHYERMPEETHGTIYHPAALRAFRALFKPR